jgi:hypothetical protein
MGEEPVDGRVKNEMKMKTMKNWRNIFVICTAKNSGTMPLGQVPDIQR